MSKMMSKADRKRKGHQAVNVEEVISAIQASGAYLQSLSATRLYADAAKNRCRHLRNLISKSKLDAASAATVVHELGKMHAPNTCKDELIGKVADKVMADGHGDDDGAVADDGPGNNQQCCMSIVNCMTEAQWSRKEFETELVSTASQLGLKNPMEGPCAAMVACAEAQSRGLQGARMLTYTHLYDHVQSIKGAIKKKHLGCYRNQNPSSDTRKVAAKIPRNVKARIHWTSDRATAL